MCIRDSLTTCEGDSILLFASGGTDYSWSGPNGFSSTLQNPIVTGNATSLMAGTYTVTVTTGGGCTETATTIVTINPAPSVTIGSNSPVCSGQDLMLTSTNPNTNVTYAWTGPNGFTSSLQNHTILNPTSANEGIYILLVTDTYTNCTFTDLSLIHISEPTRPY